MATKRTILTAAAAAATLLMLGAVAAWVRETRNKQPVTRDRADEMLQRRGEVPATDFAPRSHGS
jgi:membrane protein implicated in regulation of membrane protease activity